MSEAEPRDPGRLFGDTLALLRANLGLTAAALVVMTALGVVADSLGPDGQALNLLALPVTLGFQYEITLAGLSHLGLAERKGRRRIGALFGLNLLYALGVALGLVLIILPGLYLYIRWSVAVPVLVAEEASVGEALTRSGEEVSGRFWHVAGLFLLTGSPWLVAFGSAAIVPQHLALLGSLLLNLPVSLSLIAGWCAAVAVYADGKQATSLADIFA